MGFLLSIVLLFASIFVCFLVLMGRRRKSGYDCTTDEVIRYSIVMGLSAWIIGNIIYIY